MPSTTSPYQRVIVDGVPYWRDADGLLYYYETSTPPTDADRISLGTVASGLYSDWEERLKERLEAYREAQKPRARATAAAPAAPAASKS